MPKSLSAMLIASPMPRVPPVTIATRAIDPLPFCRLRCLSRLQPACKFALDQAFEHGDAFRRIVEAVEQREPFAASAKKRRASADPELFQGLDAIGGKAGRRDCD